MMKWCYVVPETWFAVSEFPGCHRVAKPISGQKLQVKLTCMSKFLTVQTSVLKQSKSMTLQLPL